MTYSRLSAAVFVFVLIVMVSLIGIGGVMWFGPTFLHGTNVEHDDGRILSIGPNMDFVLLTAQGQMVHFQCSARCRGALHHMERHLTEKAHTDVYFRQDTNKNLVAIDVD